MTAAVAARSDPGYGDDPGRGWRARLELGFAPRGGRTCVVHSRRSGPLSFQRPFHPEGPPCHLYLLHPPAGVVGGDRLEIDATVEPGAHALLTTPGAAKFYRSAGLPAHQTQTLRVAAGGVLEWLPQETLLFDGTDARLLTRVELGEGARFLGWEILCLGRPAAGEGFDSGRLDARLEVLRDGRPLLLERLRLAGGSAGAAAGLRGQTVSGTLIATGAVGETLGLARETLADSAFPWGVTRLDPDLLVVRCLGPGAEPVRLALEAVWRALRPGLLGLGASAPRIWAT